MVTSRGRVARSATGPLRGELVGVDAARHHADVPARHAEPGQVGLLVGAAGHHGACAAADRGLEADALDAGVAGNHVVPPLGDAEGVKRLHNGDPQVAGGGQGGEAAGPAHRVHHVGAVGAPALVQRAAELGHLAEQVGLGERSARPSAGPMYSTVTPGSSSVRSGRGTVRCA